MKRKMRFYACYFRNSNVLSWAWLCYGALCHEHHDSKQCQNGAKIAAILFLSYYYLVAKELLQAHNEKCCSLVKLLCIYFCYCIVLNHGLPVLNNIFFPKNYVSLERSERKHQTKGRNVKNANGQLSFLTNNYIYSNFFYQKVG